MFFCLFIVVQLITESIPVSSSGHVALVQSFFSIPAFFSSEAWTYFLHGPTSIILALFFRKHWFLLFRHPWRSRKVLARIAILGFCAEVPTLFCYFAVRKYAFSIPLSLGFMITGVLLFSLKYLKTDFSPLSPGKAALIGLAQGCALLPGISRMGSTYAVARHLGINSEKAFLFSCTIEWPLITAGFIKGSVELFTSMPIIANYDMILCLLIGSVLSYVVLLGTYSMVKSGLMWRWGIYMMVPSLIALFS